MAFAAGNAVRHKEGGPVLTVSSVTSNADGSQNVTCIDGHGRAAGTIRSDKLVADPARGGPITWIAPSTLIRHLS